MLNRTDPVKSGIRRSMSFLYFQKFLYTVEDVNLIAKTLKRIYCIFIIPHLIVAILLQSEVILVSIGNLHVDWHTVHRPKSQRFRGDLVNN